MLNLIDNVSARDRLALAKAIQQAVRDYTHANPMPPDEIVAVMAFCTGSAIGIQVGVSHQRLVELAAKFLADGEAIGSGKRPESTGLIDIRKTVN